jgi:hypothetical protein
MMMDVKMAKTNEQMPRAVAKRIMKRTAESGEPIVVTSRGGKPSRVYGYREYQTMVHLPNRVKPWEHRKGKKEPPDPLGARDAAPPSPLTRANMYEED